MVHSFGGPPTHPDDVCSNTSRPRTERYGTTFMCHVNWSIMTDGRYVCLDCGHAGPVAGFREQGDAAKC